MRVGTPGAGSAGRVANKLAPTWCHAKHAGLEAHGARGAGLEALGPPIQLSPTS